MNAVKALFGTKIGPDGKERTRKQGGSKQPKTLGKVDVVGEEGKLTKSLNALVEERREVKDLKTLVQEVQELSRNRSAEGTGGEKDVLRRKRKRL